MVKTKITCYNCNGLGEKTRNRGNHPSVYRVTQCNTCRGDGTLILDATNLKETIIHNLKNQKKPRITESAIILWNEVKTWCESHGYTMGGSYANWQDYINVSINVNHKTIKFKISFADLK